MVRVSVLNDCLNNIVNAERHGKRQVLVRPSSKVVVKFLSVMQRHGRIENWANLLLPARSFGIMILTTSTGILDHEEARRKNVGGKILGYVYWTLSI
ncbi:ribosomal protein S8 [Cyathus striatus]|nr:ribosomal protein S8 [Cyathus striatus]